MPSPAQEARQQREQTERERVGLPAQNARQGATGHNVRYVLGFGLAAVIIAFAVIYSIYFG